MTIRKLITLIVVSVLLVVIVFNVFKSEEERPIEKLYLERAVTNFSKLFNIDFEYMINGNCDYNGNSSLLAVILVTSYLGNVETRSAMRRAFPTDKLREFNIRRLFLLGLAPNDKYTTQKAIYNENVRFNDLLQGNFIEAYRNLTYKHMMGLRWAATHCQDAKYIIKMDDDIVVNMYKLLALLRQVQLPKNLLAGYILNGMKPIRKHANKWYITKEEYPHLSYPSFLSGWFYITNPGTCQQIVAQSAKVPYFWVDDVYVTGLLAQKQQIKHYNIGQYFTVHSEFLECCMRDVEKFKYDCEIIIGPNGGDNNLFFDFNTIVSKCYYQKCFRRSKTLNETCVGEVKHALGRGNSFVKTYSLV